MRTIPLFLVELIYHLPVMAKPQFLMEAISECPAREELRSGIVFIEVRGGHLKWAHLQCPKCGDHIQLPLAGSGRWSVKVDILRRPTLSPSIWEKATCGAHFFITKGKLSWCKDRGSYGVRRNREPVKPPIRSKSR